MDLAVYKKLSIAKKICSKPDKKESEQEVIFKVKFGGPGRVRGGSGRFVPGGAWAGAGR